jgi:hypothetical protein
MNNRYWDAVRNLVTTEDDWPGPGRFVGAAGKSEDYCKRRPMVERYCWTIPDPDTVTFVVQHCGPQVIDPLAGTGYWGWMLHQHGIDVLCSDLHPPHNSSAIPQHNEWHKNVEPFLPVLAADAADSVAAHGDTRTLLLSWPPYGSAIGEQVIRAYRGDRIIYIGEGSGGCCGDEGMRKLLESEWREIAEHQPVQWYGLHDFVIVYDRVGESVAK